MFLKNNISLLRWRIDWFRGKTKPGPPYFINIEPTNICNLNCTICSMDKSRKTGYMDIDLYRKIIKMVSDYNIVEVRLFLAGEPLLHKNIHEMIQFAKERKLLTTIHTNATTLTGDLSKLLIESGLDTLSISFHGEYKEEYESVMKGATYEKVMDNVQLFLKLKDELKPVKNSKSSSITNRKPEIIIQVVKTSPQSSLELDKNFKSRFNGLPVNRFIVLPPHNWAGEINLNEDSTGHKFYYHCQHLYQSISIAYNGDVFACCGDLNGRMVIDNIKDKTLEEIWHSDLICEMRADLKNGNYKDYKLCSTCDVLWRKRHPIITDLASSLRLQSLGKKLKSILKRK